MADVVQRPPAAGVADTWGMMGGVIDWIKINWGYLLAGLIIIILFVIIYIIFVKKEESDRERDEPGYQLYKSVKHSCGLNANKRLIRLEWNWRTLFWFLIPPFFWLTFVLKKERSMKLVNHNNQLIGYYRGHCRSMDGTLNYLLYKKKFIIFFEEQFILKMPMEFELVKKTMKTKDDNFVMDKNNNPVYESKRVKLPLTQFIKTLPNKDVMLQATSIEKIGLYYFCPVFYTGATDQTIDYRKLMEGAIIENTYQQMTTRLLNVGAVQAEKAMLHNPDLLFKKLSPEKTKEEQTIDE